MFFIVLYAAVLGMAHHAVPGFFRSLSVAFIVFAVISVERLLFRKVLMNLRYIGYNNVNAIVLGDGYFVRKVVGVMNDPWSSYRLLGMFSDSNDFDMKDLVETDADTGEKCLQEKYKTLSLGRISDVLGFIEKSNVDEVYIGLPQEYKRNLNGCLLFASSTLYV